MNFCWVTINVANMEQSRAFVLDPDGVKVQLVQNL